MFGGRCAVEERINFQCSFFTKYFIIFSSGELFMDNKEDKSSENKKTNTGAVVAGILTASVLAYCGYKLVNNCLKETKYESNPHKNVQE